MITLVGKSSKIIELPGVDAMPTRLAGTIFIESASKPELHRLANHYGLDYGNLCDALDLNESPRLERRDNFDYLYFRVPNPHNVHDVAQATQPVLAVYNSHVLIIISGNKFLPLITSDTMTTDIANTTSTIAALMYILEKVTTSFENRIKIQTDAIRSTVVKMQNHKLDNGHFVDFIMLEDHINNFISALSPLVPLLNRLQTDRNLHLSIATADKLVDIILAIQQLVNTCTANAQRIASIRDAYTTLSNDSLNRVMKTLTIATLLIAAPNLVFSMYGMNINLPMQYTDISFLLVMALALIVVVLFIIWGKKRHLF